MRIFFVKYNEFDPNWANSTLQQQKKITCFFHLTMKIKAIFCCDISHLKKKNGRQHLETVLHLSTYSIKISVLCKFDVQTFAAFPQHEIQNWKKKMVHSNPKWISILGWMLYFLVSKKIIWNIFSIFQYCQY